MRNFSSSVLAPVIVVLLGSGLATVLADLPTTPQDPSDGLYPGRGERRNRADGELPSAPTSPAPWDGKEEKFEMAEYSDEHREYSREQGWFESSREWHDDMVEWDREANLLP